MDLAHHLQVYIASSLLKSTTYFFTFEVTDVHTMLLRDESIDILAVFVAQYGYHKVQTYFN